MYEFIVPQFDKMLNNFFQLFDKAEQYAAAKKFDVNLLLAMRLSPDQFPFARQVQASCFTAMGGVALLCGKQPHKFDNDESTLDQLRQRVQASIDFLKTVTKEEFAGWEQRKIPIYFNPGTFLYGDEYLQQLTLPNFYFHFTTAYSILRHNGIDVGKADFIGHLDFKNL